MSIALACSLGACSGNRSGDTAFADTYQSSGETKQTEEKPEAQPPEAEDTAAGSNILIAYFSVPEEVDTSGADAVAGASIVVNNGEKLGNTEYVAKVIQETIGGDLFRRAFTAMEPAIRFTISFLPTRTRWKRPVCG